MSDDDFPIFDEFEVDQRKEERRAVDRLGKAISDLDEILKTFIDHRALSGTILQDKLSQFNADFLEIIDVPKIAWARRGRDRRKSRRPRQCGGLETDGDGVCSSCGQEMGVSAEECIRIIYPEESSIQRLRRRWKTRDRN